MRVQDTKIGGIFLNKVWQRNGLDCMLHHLLNHKTRQELGA